MGQTKEENISISKGPKKEKKKNKEIKGQIYGYLDTQLFKYIMFWIHFIINLWMHNMKGFDR